MTSAHLCPRCHGAGWVYSLDAAALVAAIAAEVGDRNFNAAELAAYAAAVGGPLAAALGSLKGRRLGKALRKIATQKSNGLCIECIGQDRDGAIWRVAGLADTRKAFR